MTGNDGEAYSRQLWHLTGYKLKKKKNTLRITTIFVVSILKVRNMANYSSDVTFSFASLNIRMNQLSMKLNRKNIICIHKIPLAEGARTHI